MSFYRKDGDVLLKSGDRLATPSGIYWVADQAKYQQPIDAAWSFFGSDDAAIAALKVEFPTENVTAGLDTITLGKKVEDLKDSDWEKILALPNFAKLLPASAESDPAVLFKPA